MNYWYSCRSNEIFLDLDSVRATSRALSVLRVAMLNKQLRVKSSWLYPSLQEQHTHMIIELKSSIPVPVRIAWSLWMGSDRLRAAFALARMTNDLSNIELFCSGKEYYREPDATCSCEEKHKPKEVTDNCPALRLLLGSIHMSADYFSRTGVFPPQRKKIRIPWGQLNEKTILKWKD